MQKFRGGKNARGHFWPSQFQRNRPFLRTNLHHSGHPPVPGFQSRHTNTMFPRLLYGKKLSALNSRRPKAPTNPLFKHLAIQLSSNTASGSASLSHKFNLLAIYMPSKFQRSTSTVSAFPASGGLFLAGKTRFFQRLPLVLRHCQK